MHRNEDFKLDRRGLFGAAASMIAAAIRDDPARAGASKCSETSGLTPPSFGPLKQIDAGALNIGYAELGPAEGSPVLLLHGWPYDIHSFAEVAPILASAGFRVIVPYLRGYGTTRFLSSETLRNGQQSLSPSMRSRSWTRSKSRRPFSAALIGARGPRTSSRRFGRSAVMASSR